MSYELTPDDRQKDVILLSRVEQYARNNEELVIKALKEHGTHLNYVELSLYTEYNLRYNLWQEALSQHFSSIRIDQITVTMKKDDVLDQWKFIA